MLPARPTFAQKRRAWTTSCEMRTPRYTMQVSELPVAQA
ncbi:DUF4113 domain-containing protein [Methylobacterium sp. Leaf123]